MKKLFLFGLLLSSIHILSCMNTDNSTNKDSELTLLMREMFDESMNIKTQIQNGEIPTITDKEKALLTAHSTDPEVAMSTDFKLFAQSYLAAVEALAEANETNVKGQYEVVVTSCMNCHRSLCPGPMVRIKRLYLD